MTRTMILMTTCALVFAIGCSSDEAEDAATSAQQGANEMMDHAGDAAHSMAEHAKSAASDLAGDAVAACRKLAESGSWESALEVCKKAHEMMPDDLGLEHAYQQAQAAASK